MFDYKLPVNGNDIIEIRGIKPSKEVRDCMHYLINVAFNDPAITREKCIELIKSWKR